VGKGVPFGRWANHSLGQHPPKTKTANLTSNKLEPTGNQPVIDPAYDVYDLREMSRDYINTSKRTGIPSSS